MGHLMRAQKEKEKDDDIGALFLRMKLNDSWEKRRYLDYPWTRDGALSSSETARGRKASRTGRGEEEGE
jgi:hypothetical protein